MYKIILSSNFVNLAYVYGNDIQIDPLIDEQPYAAVESLILSCSNQPSTREILDHPSQLLGENTNCDPDAGDKDKDVSGGFDGGLQVEASSFDAL